MSRRGSGPEHPAIERIAADATDADQLTALTEGAAALYNCANPLYHRWLTDWPPLASALLTAAERSGAVLAAVNNLYGHGVVDGPITETTPLAATQPKLRLRADMWREALAAHQAGRIRATEVRGSDYLVGDSTIAGDQLDPGQATSHQAAEELKPTSPVLGRGDVDPEDLTVAVGVDAGREQGVDLDHPAALAHLQHQRIMGLTPVDGHAVMRLVPPGGGGPRSVRG